MELARALEHWKSISELAWEAERTVEAAVLARLDSAGPGPCSGMIETAARLRADATLAFKNLVELGKVRV